MYPRVSRLKRHHHAHYKRAMPKVCHITGAIMALHAASSFLLPLSSCGCARRFYSEIRIWYACALRRITQETGKGWLELEWKDDRLTPTLRRRATTNACLFYCPVYRSTLLLLVAFRNFVVWLLCCSTLLKPMQLDSRRVFLLILILECLSLLTFWTMRFLLSPIVTIDWVLLGANLKHA